MQAGGTPALRFMRPTALVYPRSLAATIDAVAAALFYAQTLARVMIPEALDYPQ